MPATMSATPPPRQSQPVRSHAPTRQPQKENCPPSSASGLSPLAPPPTETPCKAPEQTVWSAQTPTKIAPMRSAVEPKQLCAYEVKNTFIHYGSPLKTVSVLTPPKTVPSNFAPEVLFFGQESARLRTPAAVFHAVATPSTAGGALAGRDYGCGAPPAVYLAAPPQAAASTLLRLSDFLPSPSASACMPTAISMSGVLQAGTQPLTTVSCTWQQPSVFVETMPPVPPLPGPPCQAPGSVLSAGVPPPPPPQFAPYDPMGHMQVPTVSYDPAQFMTGEAQQMMQMPPPQMPTQPPMLPMDQAYQFSGQYSVSPMAGMVGPSPTGAGMFCMAQSMSATPTMNMVDHNGMSTTMAGMMGTSPVCDNAMMAESCLGAFCMPNTAATVCANGTLQSSATAPSAGGAMTVSLSAAHFPEPGSGQGMMSQHQLDTMPRMDGMSAEGIPFDMTWM